MEAVGVPASQFRPDPEGLIGGMPHAEHPLVPANRADAPAHLIRERLKRQALVGGGQPGGQRIRRAAGGRVQEGVDRLPEAALEQLLVSPERNKPRAGSGGRSGEMSRKVEPVNRVQEKQRAHPLVEVVGAPAKSVQRFAGREKGGGVGAGAKEVERLVANLGIRRRDDPDQRVVHKR